MINYYNRYFCLYMVLDLDEYCIVREESSMQHQLVFAAPCDCDVSIMYKCLAFPNMQYVPKIPNMQCRTVS